MSASLTRLENRYPFSQEELQILLRSHNAIQNGYMDKANGESFLNALAHSSPYALFFLPGDEMKVRIHFIVQNILPPEFAERLRKEIFADTFVPYANEGDGKENSFEYFIEGVADCGRRGSKEALRLLFSCCCDDRMYTRDESPKLCDSRNKVEPFRLLELCYRLVIATECFTLPTPDFKEVALRHLMVEKQAAYCHSLGTFFLSRSSVGGDPLDTSTNIAITKSQFIEIAETYVPMLFTALSSFMYQLLFHRTSTYPNYRIQPLKIPRLHEPSDIFMASLSSFGFLFGCLSAKVLGEDEYWSRIYSSEHDGRSVNRLVWSILGYNGPTLLVIRSQDGKSIFGGFAATGWKIGGVQGDSECFLFQMEPSIQIYRHIEGFNKERQFMYCNVEAMSLGGVSTEPVGVGFGSRLGGRPRLFITDSFEGCSAGVLDGTYENGPLLPPEAIEQFNVGTLEVWGVGGDYIVKQAMEARSSYRAKNESTILKARTISDKSPFIEALSSGIFPTKLY